nr:MAG TPA: hypothetical protein [Caudoviricetes sp.]
MAASMTLLAMLFHLTFHHLPHLLIICLILC